VEQNAKEEVNRVDGDGDSAWLVRANSSFDGGAAIAVPIRAQSQHRFALGRRE